jgi:hypothetical protein
MLATARRRLRYVAGCKLPWTAARSQGEFLRGEFLQGWEIHRPVLSGATVLPSGFLSLPFHPASASPIQLSSASPMKFIQLCSVKAWSPCLFAPPCLRVSVVSFSLTTESRQKHLRLCASERHARVQVAGEDLSLRPLPERMVSVQVGQRQDVLPDRGVRDRACPDRALTDAQVVLFMGEPAGGRPGEAPVPTTIEAVGSMPTATRRATSSEVLTVSRSGRVQPYSSKRTGPSSPDGTSCESFEK